MCTKKYVIIALIEAVWPRISTGKIPENTAQNTPEMIQDKGILKYRLS